MASKVEQIRALLAEGYDLDTLGSDGEVMEARFRRGTRTLVVRFHAREAEALLLAKGPLLGPER